MRPRPSTKPPPPLPSTATEHADQPASATVPPLAYAKLPPPKLPWTFLRGPYCHAHIGVGTMHWCQQAPKEIQLYCNCQIQTNLIEVESGLNHVSPETRYFQYQNSVQIHIYGIQCNPEIKKSVYNIYFH